jgi:Leucine-rich repeat (LRR) protein
MNEEVLAKIQQAKDEQWTKLDLSWEGIIKLPPEIGQLTALQTIDSRGNQINKLPPEIIQLGFEAY